MGSSLKSAGKFYLGFLIYLFVMEVVDVLLVNLSLSHNWGLTKTAFTVFGIQIQGVYAILIPLALVLFIVLTRLNILPRAGSMAQASTSAAGKNASAKAAPPPPLLPPMLQGFANRFSRQKPAVTSTSAAEKPKVTHTETNDSIYEQVRAQQRAAARKRRKR